MYAPDAAAAAQFWIALRSALLAAGVADVPDFIEEPTDLASHWKDPHLLLSQTCGLPFTTALRGTVRYVCTPCFRVEGCRDGFYRSAILIRDGEPGRVPTDFIGRRVAYNARDSHSGYNGLRALIAPHALRGRFFSAAIETTSHRRSLQALRAGEADIAAIDLITLSLLRRYAPQETAGLRVIGHTFPTPGLPLITSRLTDDEQLGRLRQACAAACDPAGPAASALLLDGVRIHDEQAYDAVADLERTARSLGYPELA